MEKNNSTYKVLTILALVMAVVGVSLGFAAFSSTLTISSSAKVEVDPSNWSVGFSKTITNDKTLVTGTGNEIVASVGTGSTTGTSGTNASISTTTISGITATLVNPGDKISYSFNVGNIGNIDAYLNSVNMGSVTCSATTTDRTEGETTITGASSTILTSENCSNAIKVSLTLGTGGTATTYTTSVTSGIGSSHKLVSSTTGTFEPVTLTIEYDSTNPIYFDGDFNISIGDITLVYGTTAS